MTFPFNAAAFRQAFSNRLSARLLIAYGFDRVAAWLVTLTAVILAYELTSSIGVAAAIVLAQVVGRAVVTLVSGNTTDIQPGLVALAGIVRVAAVAGLILFTSQSDVWWATLLIALVSLSTGVIEAGYSHLIPILGQRKHIPTLNRSIGRCEQISAVAGPLVAAAALIVLDERAAFALAAILSYGALVLFRGMFGELGSVQETELYDPSASNPFPQAVFRLSGDVRAIITGLVAMAALGAVVRLALLHSVIDHLDYPGWVYAMLLSLVGAGALAGPMPVDRVLGHFPVVFVLAGGIGAVAVAAVVLGFGAPVFIIAPALLGTGLVIVTLDITASVVLRRAVPEWATSNINKTLVRLVLGGQVAALAAIFVLSRAWSVSSASLVVSAVCAVAVGVHFFGSRSFRSGSTVTRTDADKSAPEKSTT